MRVLQVTSVYYPELKFGGPPQKIHSLSSGLVERGYEVQVVTLKSGDRRAFYNEPVDHINVQYLPWIGKGSLQLHSGLTRLFRLVKWADLVHCYGIYNMLCPTAAFFARRLGRPYILEPLGMYVPRLRNVRAKELYHKLFTSGMAQGAVAVIAASAPEAKDLSHLVEPERLVLRRNGIDLEPFKHLPERSEFRERFNIDPSEHLIMYIGRISPIKNLEQLVLAYKYAALDNARLALIGPTLEPEYAARLHSLIAEQGLEEKVLMLGPLYDQDKLLALASADLFVLPSISESYGNAAAEAVAAGIPVLVTDGCGIASAIDRRAGLAVEMSVEALAEGLRILTTDDTARVQLTRDRDKVLKELSWDEPLAQTEALYTRVTLNYQTS